MVLNKQSEMDEGGSSSAIRGEANLDVDKPLDQNQFSNTSFNTN